MIVDAHVALDPDGQTVEDALRALSAARIGSAVVFAGARARDHDAANAYVLRVAREHSLYPFYYLGGNPWTDTRPDELTIPDDIDRYAGIRWHRWIGTGIDRDGTFDPDELEWAVSLLETPEFEGLAAAAAHYSLPILFEEGLAVTLETVLRFPSLDFIVPHLGLRSGGQVATMRALWDQPNVHFDTSLAQLDEATLSRVGIERILFGSGFPEGDPEREIDKIDRLPIPEEMKESVYGANAERLLAAYAPV